MSTSENKLNEFLTFVQEKFPVVAQDIISSSTNSAWICLVLSVIFGLLCLFGVGLSLANIRQGGSDGWVLLLVISGVFAIFPLISFCVSLYELWYISNYPNLVVLDYLKGAVR